MKMELGLPSLREVGLFGTLSEFLASLGVQTTPSIPQPFQVQRSDFVTFLSGQALRSGAACGRLSFAEAERIASHEAPPENSG